MERMEQALIILSRKLQGAPSFTHQAVAEVTALIRERRFNEAKAAFLKNGLQSAVNSFIGTMEAPGVRSAYKEFEDAYHAAMQSPYRTPFTGAWDQRVRPPPDRSASQPKPVQTLEETGSNLPDTTSPSSQRRPTQQPRSGGPIFSGVRSWIIQPNNPRSAGRLNNLAGVRSSAGVRSRIIQPQQPSQTGSLQRGKPDRSWDDIENTPSRQELQLEDLLHKLRRFKVVYNSQPPVTHLAGTAFYYSVKDSINRGDYIEAIKEIQKKRRSNSQLAANTTILQELEDVLLSINQKRDAISHYRLSPISNLKQYRENEYFIDGGGVDDRGFPDPDKYKPEKKTQRSEAGNDIDFDTGGVDDRGDDPISDNPTRQPSQTTSLQRGKPDRSWDDIETTPSRRMVHLENLLQTLRSESLLSQSPAEAAAFFNDIFSSLNRGDYIAAVISIQEKRLTYSQVAANTILMHELENTLLYLNQKRNAITNKGVTDPAEFVKQFRLTEFFDDTGGVDDRGDPDPDAFKPFRKLYVSDPEKKTQRSKAGNDVDFDTGGVDDSDDPDPDADKPFRNLYVSDPGKKTQRSEAGKDIDFVMSVPAKKPRQSEAGGVPVSRMLDPEKKTTIRSGPGRKRRYPAKRS